MCFTREEGCYVFAVRRGRRSASTHTVLKVNLAAAAAPTLRAPHSLRSAENSFQLGVFGSAEIKAF